MPFSARLWEEIDKLEPDIKFVMSELLKEIEQNREESITRREFLDFVRIAEENSQRVWKAIEELAEAQKRTELRVEELAEAQKRTELRVEELVEAQKRTELRVEELAEAQKRTELRVEELAEAQKRTELRVEELAEAQKRTELRVEELAEAQKRTEEELRKLSSAQRDTQKQLGGLSGTVGYTLENESYKALPSRLKKDFNIIVKDRLKRAYIRDIKGKYIEVNITGKAEREGREIVIVGESKSQLSKRGVDDFIKKKLEKLKDGIKEVFPVIVTHMISEYDVEEYVKEKGIALFYSYDF